MLNRNYKLGSRWKLALLLPLTALAFIVVSCTDKDAPIQDIKAVDETQKAEASKADKDLGPELFYIVEEMPTFNGEEAKEFRKYIAQNLKYPPEAIDAGATGKIFIKFIVNKNGKVVIPDQATLAKAEGKPLGEVVVVSYRTVSEDAEEPEDKYIEMFKNEVIRVVSSSPAWEPGRQRGKEVDVLFTFPVNFILQ